MGDDGNENDFNDMLAFISYEGDVPAEIESVEAPLPEGYIVAPDEIILKE